MNSAKAGILNSVGSNSMCVMKICDVFQYEGRTVLHSVVDFVGFHSWEVVFHSRVVGSFYSGP